MALLAKPEWVVVVMTILSFCFAISSFALPWRVQSTTFSSATKVTATLYLLPAKWQVSGLAGVGTITAGSHMARLAHFIDIFLFFNLFAVIGMISLIGVMVYWRWRHPGERMWRYLDNGKLEIYTLAVSASSIVHCSIAAIIFWQGLAGALGRDNYGADDSYFKQCGSDCHSLNGKEQIPQYDGDEVGNVYTWKTGDGWVMIILIIVTSFVSLCCCGWRTWTLVKSGTYYVSVNEESGGFGSPDIAPDEDELTHPARWTPTSHSQETAMTALPTKRDEVSDQSGVERNTAVASTNATPAIVVVPATATITIPPPPPTNATAAPPTTTPSAKGKERVVPPPPPQQTVQDDDDASDDIRGL